MLFKWASRKSILAHPKTNSSILSCQTRLELQTALASMFGWNIEKSVLTANTQDGFGANRVHKTYPSPRLNILLDRQCRDPVFLLEVLNILFRCMASWILSNTNRLKKSTPDCLCKKYYNDPKQTSKSTQRCVTEHQMKLLPWLSQFPDLHPIENEWTEENKHKQGASILKDLERLWMKEWSLISYQVQTVKPICYHWTPYNAHPRHCICIICCTFAQLLNQSAVNL